MLEIVAEVNSSEQLLESICCIIKGDSRKEGVLGVCEYEKGKHGGASSLAERKYVQVKALFGKGDEIL